MNLKHFLLFGRKKWRMKTKSKNIGKMFNKENKKIKRGKFKKTQAERLIVTIVSK